jgi:glycosyltransferase involved in cell wall biosynthesis
VDVNCQSKIRTALVHHWLVTRRGGERVLEALAQLFPSADLFTLVYEESQIPATVEHHRLHSSFLQKLPRPTRWYPYYLPLFPVATERLDLTGYDLIISSDAAMMKGVQVDANATHICYCHTPMRCIWSGYETYCQTANPLERLALAAVRTPLRAWDYRAAQRVTQFVANSLNVKRRIQHCYKRESVVIYPPVDTDQFVMPLFRQTPGDFFLVVSQLVPYKRVDLIVEAFNKCGKPLVVIGDGPDRPRLERHAKPNIRFLGFQPQRAIVEAMQQCQAFVFAGEEDFGIVMAEAQACGRPVIALGKGGALEIVDDGLTGILFEEQTADSLLSGLERFQRVRFDGFTLRASALRFRHRCFLQEFSELLNEKAAALVS